MDHSGSSCRGTTHPLISPPKANCPTHPKTTWGLKYPMELNHIESCISVSTWIFGILWVFLHVYIIWLNWYVIDDIFNICTTYICTYISYIVYILTCTVNPTIKSSGKRPSQHAYPAGYSPRRRGSPDRRAGRHGLFHFRFGGDRWFNGDVFDVFFCCVLWKLMREGDYWKKTLKINTTLLNM